jgi:glycosyltransferase involved in cell wall biosynthesis
MNILYVVHQFYPEHNSGTERFLLHLANSVQRSGHHAEVVTYSFAERSGFQKRGELRVRKYVYNRLPVTAVRHDRIPIDINTSLSDLALLEFAMEFLRAGSYDVVHIAHPMRLASFATAAAQIAVPYVITLTDFWTICPKINLLTSFGTVCTGPQSGRACSQLCPELTRESVAMRLNAARNMLQGAKAVVCPSRLVSALVKKEFLEIGITVIPHGLSLEDLPENERAYQRDSSLVFAYCGGLSPHKGVHVLVSAFRATNSEKAELRIYGAANPNEKAYERRLRDIAAVDKRIRFCGKYGQQEIGRIFQGIDVVIIPSLCYETYSFALHEALASNVPVIASAIGSLDEEIQDSCTGFVFPVGDEAALTEKLNQMMANPSILGPIKSNLKSLVCPLEEEEAYSYERIYRGVAQTEVGATLSR